MTNTIFENVPALHTVIFENPTSEIIWIILAMTFICIQAYWLGRSIRKVSVLDIISNIISNIKGSSY